jgi:hypothetical protein
LPQAARAATHSTAHIRRESGIGILLLLKSGTDLSINVTVAGASPQHGFSRAAPGGCASALSAAAKHSVADRAAAKGQGPPFNTSADGVNTGRVFRYALPDREPPRISI